RVQDGVDTHGRAPSGADGDDAEAGGAEAGETGVAVVGGAPAADAGADPAAASAWSWAWACVTKARMTRTSTGLCSGCHWTASSQGWSSGPSSTSIVPSSACAVTVRPSPTRSTDWWWEAGAGADLPTSWADR